MLCHNWPSCDPHFLDLLASSKQHSILRLQSYFYYAKDSIQKYKNKVKGKIFSFWSKESFLKLSIWFWAESVCLSIWNISLLLVTCFCSWVLQVMREGNLWVTYEYFNVLVVRLCKPVVYKLKMLDIGKLEYYKSMERTTKKGRGQQILKFQWGKAKDGGQIFWLKFSGGKYWRKLCWKNVVKSFFVCKCKSE